MMKKTTLLKRGDRVGIIAPGAYFKRENFEKGIARIKEMGLVPVYGPNLFKKDFLFAGTVKQRTHDFLKMANDKTIKAIWCVRGGSGSYAVAQEVARFPIPRQPKPVIGLSDITALHLLLVCKWKWPVIHGPLVDRVGSELHRGQEKTILEKTLFNHQFKLSVDSGLTSVGAKKNAVGRLVGGNLATVVSSIGSLWEIDTKDKILFFEEIFEPAYRVDRFLWQLGAAGKFKNIKGIVFGDFTDCQDKDGKQRWKEVLKRHFGKSAFPVIYGLKSGHGRVRLALPFGLKARVSARGKPEFKMIESFG